MIFFKYIFNLFSNKENFSNHEKIIFLGIFSIVASLVLFNHEMWRDEIQAWLLARDSSNFLNLLNNLRYEGHTPLWHFLLFPLTKLQLSISSKGLDGENILPCFDLVKINLQPDQETGGEGFQEVLRSLQFGLW